MPQRIQRKRTKGWRMPEGAVYVGRPTVWGNRYQVGTYSNTLGRAVETIEEAVRLYREVIWSPSHMQAWIRENLRGKDLACWCPLDQPCHADVLLEIANPMSAAKCMHTGTFSFGCMPGVIRCDECGEPVTEENARRSFARSATIVGLMRRCLVPDRECPDGCCEESEGR